MAGVPSSPGTARKAISIICNQQASKKYYNDFTLHNRVAISSSIFIGFGVTSARNITPSQCVIYKSSSGRSHSCIEIAPIVSYRDARFAFAVARARNLGTTYQQRRACHVIQPYRRYRWFYTESAMSSSAGKSARLSTGYKPRRYRLLPLHHCEKPGKDV